MGRVPPDVVGVPRERVARDVETEGLLLLGEPVALGPFLLPGDPLLGRLRLAATATAPEEPELPALPIALRRRALRERRFDGVHRQREARFGEPEIEVARCCEQIHQSVFDRRDACR